MGASSTDVQPSIHLSSPPRAALDWLPEAMQEAEKDQRRKVRFSRNMTLRFVEGTPKIVNPPMVYDGQTWSVGGSYLPNAQFEDLPSTSADSISKHMLTLTIPCKRFDGVSEHMVVRRRLRSLTLREARLLARNMMTPRGECKVSADSELFHEKNRGKTRRKLTDEQLPSPQGKRWDAKRIRRLRVF